VVIRQASGSAQLLVDCDADTTSRNQRKALEYGIAVVTERQFWEALGVQELTNWSQRR
jgi:hypothetical protein